MNDSKIAAKLRAQLKNFLGELLPHFSKPKVAFLGDMFYGLMAGGDVKLSKICRAYRPAITMKKAGDRLCMHLGADGRMLLSRCGRWTGFDECDIDDEPDLFKFFDCDD